MAFYLNFSNSAVASSSLIHNLGPGNQDLLCVSGVTTLRRGCESPPTYVTLYENRGQGLQSVPSDQSLPGVPGSPRRPAPLPCDTFGRSNQNGEAPNVHGFTRKSP